MVSDDIYEHIYWADEPFVSFATACPGLFDRTVTVNGVSKGYAMTGWRIGYAGGPPASDQAMKTIQSQSTSNPCSVSQGRRPGRSRRRPGGLSPRCAAYKQRHDYVVAHSTRFRDSSAAPGEGAFYAFPSAYRGDERPWASRRCGPRRDLVHKRAMSHGSGQRRSAHPAICACLSLARSETTADEALASA